MGTLMLLGGSNGQLSAARAVKALGHRLVLVDYLQTPPAQTLCDVHARVSTFDVNACIQTAKEHRIDGVFTVGTDQPVLTAACVAEALSLPSPISTATARKATNKRDMKEAFRLQGIPHVPFAYFSPDQSSAHLAQLGQPLVIKPLDSQGQRGVFKVQTPAEAALRLPETLRHSRENSALVETFYPSDEVTFSGFLYQGRLTPLLLTDRQLLDDPLHIGVCAAHRYPSIHAARMTEITQLCKRVAEAIGAQDGALYVQLLIGEQGVLVNEVACRIGGAYEDAMIRYASGFDILSAVIHGALGQNQPRPDLSFKGAPDSGLQMSVQMLFCMPGVIGAITPIHQLLALPGVLCAGYHYLPGDRISPMENATNRFGHCALATRRGDMASLVAQMYQTLQVTDTQGQTMIIPRTFDGERNA